MSLTRTTPPRKISEKRLKSLGGKMPFSTIAKRSHPLAKKRVSPIPARAKKRERNDKRRIYGPQTFVAFLHSHECLGCDYRTVEQAHLKSGGTGRKDDWSRTVPLCGRFDAEGRLRDLTSPGGCHQQYDAAKRSAFAQMIREMREHFWARWCLFCGKSGLDPQTGKPPV